MIGKHVSQSHQFGRQTDSLSLDAHVFKAVEISKFGASTRCAFWKKILVRCPPMRSLARRVVGFFREIQIMSPTSRQIFQAYSITRY